MRIAPAFLRRSLEYINDHLEEDLKLAKLAEIAGTSPYHFARQFRRAVGLPPHEYVIERRVEQAKRLLLNRDLTVTEVAMRTGFASQSHLSTVFRKLTNAAPTEYRADRQVSCSPAD